MRTAAWLDCTRQLKLLASALLLAALAGCVTVKPPEPVIINGAAGYSEPMTLPPGCRITIAIIDLDTPGQVIDYKSFDTVRVPVPFKFILPAERISPKVNYGVVALIKHNNRVIFQTYDRYPVINNGTFTAEVIMKAVANP